MNGFTSAILSLLLGWLRALLDQFWRLLSSESDGSFLSFLTLHWKTFFIVLCVGGFVLDRIIFFFRWRPDYVWGTKLGRLKRRFSRSDKREPAYPSDDAGGWGSSAPTPYEALYDVPMPYSTTPPQDSPDAFDSYVPEEVAAFSYTPVAAVQDFAPLANQSRVPYESAPSPGYVWPVFDDPAEDWDGYAEPSSQAYAPMFAYEEPYEHPAQDLPSAFGEAKPEPAGYHDDVAGFIPQLPSEEPTQNRAAPIPGELVHPGLDLDTFHQNIGLSMEDSIPSDIPSRGPLFKPVVNFPNTTYVPYYQETEPSTDHQSKGTLSSFAKKAKNLVSIDNEANPLTIRDIQIPVNVKTAFHPPVMPRKLDDGDDA